MKACEVTLGGPRYEPWSFQLQRALYRIHGLRVSAPHPRNSECKCMINKIKLRRKGLDAEVRYTDKRQASRTLVHLSFSASSPLRLRLISLITNHQLAQLLPLYASECSFEAYILSIFSVYLGRNWLQCSGKYATLAASRRTEFSHQFPTMSQYINLFSLVPSTVLRPGSMCASQFLLQ